jgi:hypothetical protein
MMDQIAPVNTFFVIVSLRCVSIIFLFPTSIAQLKVQSDTKLTGVLIDIIETSALLQLHTGYYCSTTNLQQTIKILGH